LLYSVFFAFVLVFTSAREAHAAVTINSVDESRVSNVVGLGTATVVVYGGLAGSCASTAPDRTCSSCVANTAGGDNGLLACNDRRINPDLVFSITVTSSDHDGYPNIGVAGTGTGTGSILTQVAGTSASLVSKGSPATINITWRNLCNVMATTATSGGSGGTVPTNCVLGTTDDAAQATFYVGMKQTNDTTPFGSSDDYQQLTIVIRKGEDGTAPTLAETSGNGITYFEFDSGDNKGTIKNLSCTQGNGFPNYQNIRFQWVRVLFEKRDDPNTPVWSRINSGSPHTDLEIGATGTCDTDLSLSPIIVTDGTAYDASGNASAVGVANDNVYDTKVAVVDQARNVAFYTPQTNDEDCDAGDASRSPVSGHLECHTIRPAVVAGVLANKVNCFIATASYGSSMASEVDTFRHFRDTYLIPTKLGLKFVRWYYNNGPTYAKFIAQNETYRAIARGFLWLPLQFAKISMSFGLVAGLAFLMLVILSPIALIAWVYRRQHRRSTRHHA
jgi:hypothetical protein